MLFKWIYNQPTSEEKTTAEKLSEKLSIGTIPARLLVKRGITTESAANWLTSSIRSS